MRNYVLLFMVLFSLTAFNARTSAQTCTPSTPVCVPANGYAFQYFADTDYGLKFNTTTAEYQFTNAAGVGLFNIHANNGLVTVKEDLQVDGKVGIGSGNPMAVDFSVFNGVGHFGVPAGYAQFDQDGDLEFIGTADYLVDGNRYAFRYKAAQGYGLFFNATNSRYEFRTNNATPVSFIHANSGNGYFKGSLGVGNTAPVDKIHILGGGSGNRIRIESTGNGWAGMVGKNSLGEMFVGIQGPFDPVPGEFHIFDNVAIAQRMVIDNSGNVGIGIPTPTSTLDINGNARIRTLSMDNSLNNIVVADSNGLLHTRDFTSLNDGDWTKDPFASNNYFNNSGRFEIGFDSAVSYGLNVHNRVVGSTWFEGAIRGAGPFGPTIGYVGHQGQFSYQQDASLSLSGQEIGILGRSTGASFGDNYGVLGHSNNWGGRFQYTNGTSVSNIVYLGGSNSEIAASDGEVTTTSNIGIRRSTPNNTVIGQLYFSEPNFPNSWAGIRAWSEGGDDQVSLAFHTAYGTSNSALFIDQFGDIGFGGINASYQLQLSIDEGAKPSTSTWTIVSDERLKNINGTYDKGLDEILMLEPITYHYKNVGEVTFDENVLAKENIGFSAQEIQKVFPECVNTNENGYLDFNMHAILVAQVNAIKEQQAQIDKLKKPQDQSEEIQELKAENADMKDRLTKIEQMLLQFDLSLDECCSNHQQQGNSVPAFDQPSLGQNIPNPFESSTIIPYYIPDNTESAYMIVNNIDGKELRNYPIDQFGLGKVTFKTQDLSAGTYMYTLFVNGDIVDSKLMIVK